MPPKKPIRHNDWVIYHYAKLSSSNDLAREMISSDTNLNYTAIIADQQTAGRGSKGRVWEGLSKSSLLTSIITDKLEINPYLLTLYISLLIADTLKNKYPLLNIHVKWLNDIYLDNLKLGGVLIEKVEGRYIIGIGLNIHKQKIISSYLGKYISDITAMDILKLILDRLNDVIGADAKTNKELFDELFAKYNIFEHFHFELTLNGIKHTNLIYHSIDELGRITFWDGERNITLSDTDKYKIDIGKIRMGV